MNKILYITRYALRRRRFIKIPLLIILLSGLFSFITAVGVLADEDTIKGIISETDYELYLMQNGLPYPSDFKSRSGSRTERIGLDGEWLFQTDPEDNGVSEGWFKPEHTREDWRISTVPGSWNAIFPDLFRYKGDAWYARKVGKLSDINDKLAIIRIGAAFLESEVWFNGRRLGGHSGGYTPAYYEIKPEMWEDNENWLVVRIDNRISGKTVPAAPTLFHTDHHGWYPWGGINRDVYIETVSPVFIFKADVRAVPINSYKDGDFTAYIGIYNHSDKDNIVELNAVIREAHKGGGREIRFESYRATIPMKGIKFLELHANIRNITLWHTAPEGNVASYQLISELKSDYGKDSVNLDFGFREFKIQDGGLYLNGKPHFLYGINRHEDAPGLGPVQSEEFMETDIGLLKELGVNHIRPGHYPCDEEFLNMLDEAGITATEEIPAYQLTSSEMSNPDITAIAETQLIEMIERDRNHPSIIIWSLANEISTYEPPSRDFIRRLNKTAKKWDPTRYTTVAIAGNPYTPVDYVSGIVDVVSINEYFGWYYGQIEDLDKFLDKYHKKFLRKPFVISEFGADALLGRHIDEIKKESHHDHSYSEEFQDDFYRRHWEIISAKPYIVGTMPWVFADFHMEWTPLTGKPHPVEWMNLKGLLTINREKKMSFYTIQEFYRRHRLELFNRP
ncbi:MAG: glycoside hydrolase family 2 TIM barrel-domain containing protein [bacterium]